MIFDNFYDMIKIKKSFEIIQNFLIIYMNYLKIYKNSINLSNYQRKRERIMKNQKIERILNELNIELRYFNEFSEIGLKISEFRELSDNEEFNQNFQIIDEEKNLKIIRDLKNNQNILKIKIIQIHIQKNQDIKLEMIKIDRYNLKLIYHMKKNQKKEYRIFISYKNSDNKLKRFRLLNEDIMKIQNNEKKMRNYLNNIIEEKNIQIIDKFIKEKSEN